MRRGQGFARQRYAGVTLHDPRQYRFSLEWEGLKGKDRGMRLHDPEACEVGGTGCLMRDKWLAYVFLGRLLEKQRKGILAHILGQFI
ncbi:MAG: hypothetical protein H6Q48_2203 [Deltaproteobacteria bacterium]|nr:hypothetical protein [Deltaproteobacteria bacterium]